MSRAGYLVGATREDALLDRGSDEPDRDALAQRVS